jgi:HemX protein
MTTLAYLALALYAASFGLYPWSLHAHNRAAGRSATLCLAAGLALHYLALHERARAAGTVPYQDLYGSTWLFAWFLAATYLLLERFHGQRAVAPFILPFIIVLVLLPNLLAPQSLPNPPARGPMFALHVTSNILAYAAFALSCILSSVYLVQNRVLRDRRVGGLIWQFPALEELERMSRSSVMVGMCALIFGSALGSVWSHRILGSYFTGDPKEIASYSLLVLYAAYLWLGRTAAWRGARASALCVANFVVVLFSYTVVNLYLSEFHRFF